MVKRLSKKEREKELMDTDDSVVNGWEWYRVYTGDKWCSKKTHTPKLKKNTKKFSEYKVLMGY